MVTYDPAAVYEGGLLFFVEPLERERIGETQAIKNEQNT